ncbi:hypothetical protein SAMN04487949_2276 [Halogranum gelatinilyticum]|uniref:Uncharacterized protein n=1 Tax=Halogranum gelatinilyticum TaxID=660521 RepID=A0A1G9UQA9_9EURY|nr:hypothetical protein [Halogranum gelatinilyticum]SDM61745.1 hypothetical protein SAMN04487949_2276 [Halogranum gelatinilyticum]
MSLVAPSQLLSLLEPVLSVIVPAFVVGFFLVSLVAIALNSNRTVRNVYIAGFFALLLVVNLAAPVTPAPLVKWHKFSEVRDTEQTEYVFRVVDADGAELGYDDDATLEMGSVALTSIQLRMRTEFTPEKNVEVAQWMLDRAAVHRADVEANSWTRYLAFPRHGLSNSWTPATLEDYGEFTTLRLYRVDFTMSEDGSEVTSYSETLVYEYDETRGVVVDNTGARESRLDAAPVPRVGTDVAARVGTAVAARVATAPVASALGIHGGVAA